MQKKSFKEKLPLYTMIGPTVVWLLLFLVIPLLYVVGISFLSKRAVGGVELPVTLEAYKSLFSNEYVKVFARSFWLAIKTAVGCLLIGYPFAYVIAHSPKKMRSFLVLLVMLPFWINSMIRLYGWVTLMRREGVINQVLLSLGIIDSPLGMLYTDGAVLLGMIYDLLPFAILPMYTSIEKLDKTLVEAARDLGATSTHVFRRVILPQTMPGIFAATIQTFIPALGLFYISDMLGGGKSIYLGNLIKNQFLSARNWPLGAALALVLIIITLVLMKLYTKVGSLDDMV